MRHVRRYLKRAWLSWKARKPNAPSTLREALLVVETIINKTETVRLGGNAPEDLATDMKKMTNVLVQRRAKRAQVMDRWYSSKRAYKTNHKFEINSQVLIHQVFSNNLFTKTEVPKFYKAPYTIVGIKPSEPITRYIIQSQDGQIQPGSFPETQLIQAPNGNV
jgi:hypothetical protein